MLYFICKSRVPESGGREERHRIHVAWSPVWSFHSQWWFGLPCHLLVLGCYVICCLLLTSFMEMLISFSSRTWHLPALPTVPKACSMTMCYCAWLASKLAWPEAHRESMMRDTRPNNTDDLKPRESRWEKPDPTMQMTWRPLSKQPGLHYTWAVPRADCLHAAPHWCSNSCKKRPNQVLSA